jgi:hypothetical protein
MFLLKLLESSDQHESVAKSYLEISDYNIDEALKCYKEDLAFEKSTEKQHLKKKVLDKSIKHKYE